MSHLRTDDIDTPVVHWTGPQAVAYRFHQWRAAMENPEPPADVEVLARLWKVLCESDDAWWATIERADRAEDQEEVAGPEHGEGHRPE